jgi:hypothetical protein
LHSVGITEQSGIYNQYCYIKAATNTATDPIVPGTGGKTVGEWRAKCDVKISNINNPFIVSDNAATGSTTRVRVWELFRYVVVSLLLYVVLICYCCFLAMPT